MSDRSAAARKAADHIHVSDRAAAHDAALRQLMPDPGQSPLLNCGCGHGASVNDVLDAVDRVAGVTLDRRLAPRRPGDSDTLVAATGRIHRTLDWTPRHDSLDTIIAHARAWERQLAHRTSV